jgi:hypothetical protein
MSCLLRSHHKQDTDILATAPLAPLLHSIPRFEEGGVALFSDVTTRYGGSGPVELHHGGAVVLQRNASEPCCRDWCAAIHLPALESDPVTAATIDDQFAMGKAAALYERTRSNSTSSGSSSSSSYRAGCRVYFLPDRYMLSFYYELQQLSALTVRRHAADATQPVAYALQCRKLATRCQ